LVALSNWDEVCKWTMGREAVTNLSASVVTHSEIWRLKFKMRHLLGIDGRCSRSRQDGRAGKPMTRAAGVISWFGHDKGAPCLDETIVLERIKEDEE
jgi:hypothetical protein